MEESLRDKIYRLIDEIYGEVDHGECFHEQSELEDFVRNLDNLKELAYEYYNENQKED